MGCDCQVTSLSHCSRSTDTEAEINFLREAAIKAGAFDAVLSSHWEDGGTGFSSCRLRFQFNLLFSFQGAGAKALAEAVVRASEQPSSFKLLYDIKLPIEEKIEIICKSIYRAAGIELLGQ